MDKINFNFVTFKQSIKYLIEKQSATDVHITPGAPPYIRQAKKLQKIKLPTIDEETNTQFFTETNIMTPNDTKKFVEDLIDYSQAKNANIEIDNDDDIDLLKKELKENHPIEYQRAEELKKLITSQELDTTLSIRGVSRFRVHISMQRRSLACSIRVVPSKVPDFKGMPQELKNFLNFHNGLIIISGKTSSGKSTTLATLINEMNNDPLDKRKIITLEDPIEYLFKHNNCLILQREVGSDTKSYKTGLLSALREDPDVLVIGELRDVDSFEIVLNAAESGTLVIVTMHSSNTREAIERLVSMFPDDKQNQTKAQLASVLKGVISQQLLPCIKEGYPNKLIPAFEIMTTNTKMASAIAKGDFKQIVEIMAQNRNDNMRTMKDSLSKLRNSGFITEATFLERKDS